MTLNGPDSRLARGHNKDLLSHSRVHRISNRVASQGKQKNFFLDVAVVISWYLVITI